VYSARSTKCGLALYTVTVDVNRVYDSKARRYTLKTTEQNRIVRTGKSETEVTNNKINCARGIVLSKLTTDRHEASRGLFATAELLVLYVSQSTVYRYIM